MPPPYQVFISFKQTDDKGQATRDSLLARAIHDHLTARGLRVFFAPVALEGLGRSDFSQAIDDALEQAQIMVVVGTREANIKARWVRSEWNFFISAVNSGRKPSGDIFTYVENIPINDLPPLLSTFTCFEHKDGQGLEKLWVYIRGALNLSEMPPQAVPEMPQQPDRAEPTRARPAARPPIDEMTLDLGGVPMTFVRVPAGEFWMGGEPTDHEDRNPNRTPMRRVHLNEYWIGKYPVTGAQYAAFLKDSGYRSANDLKNPKKPDHPVIPVSWDDATAFCAWASELCWFDIRLPSEAEWEKAARGTDGRLYPWGNDPPDKNRCNFDNPDVVGGTTPVGQYSPAGDSPYGCADMAGNVWEWCQDWFEADHEKKSPSPGTLGKSPDDMRSQRGGSFIDSQKGVSATSRMGSSQYMGLWYYGFRVVASALSAEDESGDDWSGWLIDQVPVEEQAHKKESGAQSGGTTHANGTILDLGGVPMTFVRVPAGEFWMGSDKMKDKDAFSGESPQHLVRLDEYWISKYPVTVAQFAAFIRASGYQTTAEKQGSGFIIDSGKWIDVKGACWKYPRGRFRFEGMTAKDDHPVTLVSWDDAAAFCAWASQIVGRAVGLPTEEQWEKAARGTDGRLYPWGSQEPDAGRCNFNMNMRSTTPVGKYSPAGDSPYGCADMAGNVGEWCQDWVAANYSQLSPADKPPWPSIVSTRCLRGGSWNSESRYMRCASRLAGSRNDRYADRGFRVALTI